MTINYGEDDFGRYHSIGESRPADVLFPEITAKRKANPAHCVFCNAIFSWGPQDNTPGRIYSLAGKKEAGITGVCETCFDNIMPDDDDEDFVACDLTYYCQADYHEDECHAHIVEMAR